MSVPGPTLMEGSSWGDGAYAVGHMYGAPLRMEGGGLIHLSWAAWLGTVPLVFLAAIAGNQRLS